jgi:hypothetical protein
MKTKRLLACCLLFCCLLCCLAAAPSGAQDAKPKQKSEQFSALAYLPSGAGRRMIGAGRTANVDLYVEEYSTDDEAQMLAGKLLDGGPDTVLNELEHMKSKGKIQLTGRVGFYDLKFVRSRPTATGRRVSAVTDRPIGFLEAFYSGRSEDYKFGIVILDLKTNKKGKEEGQGEMIYAAKVKVIDGNKVEVENYGIDPVRLMSVRKF